MGTMAAGNFSILVILIASIYLKRSRLEIFSNFVFTLIIFILYTRDYQSLNASPLETFVQHPYFVAKYVLTYFTYPLNQLVGSQFSLLLTIITLIMFLAVLKKIFGLYGNGKNNAAVIAGLMLFSYSVLVAVASAGGRFDFGINQANSSRYATISLLGWFGALLVVMHKDGITSGENQTNWIKLSFAVSVAFIPFQIANSGTINDVKVQRDFAAVVLLQNIQDDTSLSALYPNSLRLITLSKALIQEEKSIFTREFKQRFKYGVLNPKNVDDKPDCLGFVDIIRPSSDGKGFVSTGWISISDEASKHLDLLGTDTQGRVIGFGISGFTRNDVSQQLGSWGRKSGFNLISKEVPRYILATQESNIMCKLRFGDKDVQE